MTVAERPKAAGDQDPSRVRRIGNAAVRAVGELTAGLRPPPDFLLIGAKRAGTTSLYYSLLEHPQVLPLFPSATLLPLHTNTKGVHYFDSGYGHGERWYRSHFPTAAYRRLRSAMVHGPVVSGEGSPYYLFHPRVAERAARDVPGSKVIVVLRDPVERAYSHYKEQRSRGLEPLDTFEAAIAAEDTRLHGVEEHLARDEDAHSFAHEHQAYVRQGHYAEQLQPWFDRFPPPLTLVLFSADLYRSPQDSVDEVCRFLEIEPHILTKSEALNVSDRSPMSEETRERLREHYEAHDEALARLLRRPLPWRL